MRESSAIGTLHACPKFFQSAELKLLHGSFAAMQLLSNLPNALFLDETQQHHPALILRKMLHHLEQSGTLLNLFHGDVLRIVRNWIPALPGGTPPTVDNAV